MYDRLHSIPACDRQTDGQTSCYGIVRVMHTRRAVKTRRALGGAHVPPTKVFRRLTGSVNKTIVKPRVAAAANTYTSDFPDVKLHVPALIRQRRKQFGFRHPDYNSHRAQRLISSSMSRLSTSVDTQHFIKIHARVFE